MSEWQGKTDDAAIPVSTKRRIVERQAGCCAVSGHFFRPGDVIHFDHKKPLWEGGEHRENNIQAIMAEPHKEKTREESRRRAKIYKVRDKHLGIAKPKRPWSKFKKKMNGEVVRRDEE